MRKVIIFYASYGGGHLSAARSIKEYIENHYDDVELKLVDCMEYVNKVVNKVTTKHMRKWQKKHHVHGEEFIGNPKKDHSLI